MIKLAVTFIYQRREKSLIILSLLYFVFVGLYIYFTHRWLSPDQVVIALLILLILLFHPQHRLFDWFPVVLIGLGYQMVSKLTPQSLVGVHIEPMIYADKFIFGFLPTITLQNSLYDPKMFHWYDYLATILYSLHYVFPFIIGLYLWLSDRNYFKRFTTAFVALSFIGYATYILYPAMPPWMASGLGYLPHLKEIPVEVANQLLPALQISSVIHHLGVPRVAAMPSLHAAWPTMIFLFLIRKSRIIGGFYFLYLLGVWFSVIYLGEHYVIDVIIGIFYSLSTYLVLSLLLPRLILKTKKVFVPN